MCKCRDEKEKIYQEDLMDFKMFGMKSSLNLKLDPFKVISSICSPGYLYQSFAEHTRIHTGF